MITETAKCRFYQRKSGNTLVLVILLFMVMTIFALAALALAQSETRKVSAEKSYDQAYYVARSVVDATVEWAAHNYYHNDFNEVVPMAQGENNSFGLLNKGELDGYEYDLKIWRDASISNLVFVKSTAQQVEGGVSMPASAMMSFTINASRAILFNDAVYAKDTLNKPKGGSHGIHNGNISTGAMYVTDGYVDDYVFKSGWSKSSPETSEYAVFLDRQYEFPDSLDVYSIVSQDQFLPYLTNTQVNSITATDDITVEYIADEVTLSGEITIDNNDSTRDIYIIINNTLNIDSKATIKPLYSDGGRIFFIARGPVVTKPNAQLSIEGDDGVQRLKPLLFLVFDYASGSLSLSGDPSINTYLYAPDFSVTLKGGGTESNPNSSSELRNFYGAIIAKSFSLNGNVEIYYTGKPDLEGTPFKTIEDYNLTQIINNKTWLID